MAQTPSAYSQNPPTPPEARSQALYGGDPTTAMMAVLQKMGYNPFKTNPFVSMLMQAAPGLQSAWQLSNIGANADDMSANGGPAQMFGDFLGHEIGSGSVFSTLRNASQNLPGYLGQIRDLQDRLGQGADPTKIPVFLDQLESTLNSPGGFAKLQSGLVDPLLGQALSRSYNNSLGAASQGAYTRYVEDPQFGTPQAPNFFDFLMRGR
jgi:hypothetical protein